MSLLTLSPLALNAIFPFCPGNAAFADVAQTSAATVVNVAINQRLRFTSTSPVVDAGRSQARRRLLSPGFGRKRLVPRPLRLRLAYRSFDRVPVLRLQYR